MLLKASILLCSIAMVCNGNGNAKSRDRADPSLRSGKFLSLFNIVQFENSPCNSQYISPSTDSSNSVSGCTTNRNGICYDAASCSRLNGQASGNCAAGFGVCCLFILQDGDTTVTQNCTYIQNPGFPGALTSPTAGLSYTINKCSNNVCSLRLDFCTFMTVAQTNSVELLGGACVDPLTITTTSTPGNVPVICGKNSGQHVYVDLGNDASDTATLSFAFGSVANGQRMWDIKVTQVLCGRNSPPAGCVQYLTGTSGEFQSFNFADASGTTTNLANQLQKVCIRQSEGFCCIQYMPCADMTSSNTLNVGVNNAAIGLIDSQCATSDFIQFDGVSSNCVSTGNNQVSKICGTLFSSLSSIAVMQTLVNIPLCDCSQPFEVTFVTNGIADLFSAKMLSRGECLSYQQIPCSSSE